MLALPLKPLAFPFPYVDPSTEHGREGNVDEVGGVFQRPIGPGFVAFQRGETKIQPMCMSSRLTIEGRGISAVASTVATSFGVIFTLLVASFLMVVVVFLVRLTGSA